MDTEGQVQEEQALETPVVADTGEGAPPAEAAPADPFESFARERGWSPKEEWRGKPEDWREPKDFISYGMERGRAANQEVRELKSTVDRIGRVSEQIMKRTIEEQRRELEAQFAGAVENKDHEGARAAREELGRLDRQPAEPDIAHGVEDFKSRNASWFGTNRAATLVAQGITAQLAAQGVPPSEQLRQAEEAVKAEFPHLFGAAPAAKPAPSVSAPTSRAANPTAPKKSFATLPAEAQRAGQDFLKKGMVKTLEDYAKVYYDEGNA